MLFLFVRTVISVDCDIVILGGTLAALGSAIEAPTDQRVCLVEPTSRLGGQFGDEGVWHIDFNWFYQPGYPDKTVSYNPANLHPFLRKVAAACNTGGCWVSRNCFTYDCIKAQIKLPQNLQIFWNSLAVNLTRKGQNLESVRIVQRTVIKKDCRSAGQRIKDWYQPRNSQFYSKQSIVLNIKGILIQASQYGDALVLGRSFQQGIPGNQSCGQSTVFGLHQVYPRNSTNQYSAINSTSRSVKEEEFSLDNFTVQQIWRYRRLIGSGASINPGQLCLQNWNGPGNDYKGGYLFLPKIQIDPLNYAGGLNFTTLNQAEQRSIRYHNWYKSLSGLPLQPTNDYFEGCFGLSPLPYLRDGRRANGYQGFQLKVSQVTGLYQPGNPLTAQVFWDRVCLGYYNIDIHPINDCQYDPDIVSNTGLPFFIPLRALSSSSARNLIVAGRAMAQDFYAASATRTHVTEMHTGVAAMKTAQFLLKYGLSMWELVDNRPMVSELQKIIRQTMPLQWSINGSLHPSN